jgi:hypothetical protein
VPWVKFEAGLPDFAWQNRPDFYWYDKPQPALNFSTVSSRAKASMLLTPSGSQRSVNVDTDGAVANGRWRKNTFCQIIQ